MQYSNILFEFKFLKIKVHYSNHIKFLLLKDQLKFLIVFLFTLRKKLITTLFKLLKKIIIMNKIPFSISIAFFFDS